MATQPSLLIVADYPYVRVGRQVFAEIPWDAALADLYASRFSDILLLGRSRQAAAAPPGWFPVDASRFTVLDGGDWGGVGQFVRNLPRLRAALRAVWPRVGVLHVKLFYLNAVAAWWFNRRRRGADRKPVASLLVGDAAEAMLLRDDLLPLAWMRRLAAGVVAWVIRGIQRRVEIAGYVAEFLAEKFPSGPARTLVVSESWLHDDQVQVHGRTAPRTPPTVLFVGRLIPRKRPRLLLQAIARLAGDGVDVRCVLVGEGPERAGLEALARDLGIASRVRFPGWLGLLSPAMLEAYDGADVFCLPSFAEGLPLVLIEAMGRGAGVIATAVSGTPEMVHHEQTGLLIPRDDLDALTAAIRRLLTEPGLWHRCVEGGYRMARQYTFEAQRTRLANEIGGLLR